MEGVSTPPYKAELWGEPLDRSLPPKPPYVGWGALYSAPLEEALGLTKVIVFFFEGMRRKL